ncbi:MAG: phosphoribosylaminoimidazolesuccinocarboxamide synthase [Rhodospirillales bacterium]|nr:phosphoribosylaminoimidazolesuccinocarboxamide synthase [Rhodospirillales bacterium]
MVDPKKVAPYLDQALGDIAIAELPNHSKGKVRDSYDLPDGRRIIVASDRLSAFDRVLTTIPLKGQALTQIARFWFDATSDLCPNHIEAYPDPNVAVCKRLRIMPVEIVVRGYLTGTTNTSIWPLYKAGHREMYGIRFPEGLRENQALPHAILTPTTKASDGGHDEPLAARDIIDRGLLTRAQWQTVSDYALALFERGRSLARERGLILVDTKYEFGFDGDGRILVADEMHTPDSSRYWLLDSYAQRFESGARPDSFDKDVVRNWVNARCNPYKDPIPEIPRELRLQAAATYIGVFESITGSSFAWPDAAIPPLSRIRAALHGYMAAAQGA